jgi:hypothetical protein
MVEVKNDGPLLTYKDFLAKEAVRKAARKG